MAVVIENRIVYLHVPKTGGMWVRSLLRQNGIDHHIWSLPRLRGFEAVLIKDGENHHLAVIPPDIEPECVFCTIRDPADWYLSMWLFRHYTKWRWDNRRHFDALVSWRGRHDFGQFIRDVADRYPQGILHQIYRRYIDRCDTVLTMATLERRIGEVLGCEVELPEPANVRRREYLMDADDAAFIRGWESEALRMVRAHE